MAVAACGVTGKPAEGTGGRPTGLPKGEVTWITDGDTIEVDLESGSTTVRLLGINAPDDGECFLEEATEHLIQSLKGSVVGVDRHGEDQFGRTLAYVWQGDDLVNLELVQLGFAIATTPDEAGPPGGSLVVAEQHAYETGIGLWGETVCGASSGPAEFELDTSAFNPAGPDGDDLTGEFVVVSNTSDRTVDFAGWILRDESSAHRYRFGKGTVLKPGERLQITSADTGWEPGGQPVWNNGGDMALLLDANGRVVARWRYP
jgi:endonuclease YncB( thermonuclease family)